MIYKTFENYTNGENTYLLMDEDTKDAILIDPGYGRTYPEDINVKFIFLTHCHYDHISDINNFSDAKIVCSKNCANNLLNKNVNLSEFGLGYKLEKEADIILEDNEVFDFFGKKIKCIYTPGHTDGSCCYLTDDRLYSGDTLFYESIGRCDLPTGNFNEITISIKNKIYTLSDDLKVYPGHGEATSVGHEKLYNLYVNNR